jgi:sodium/potassium-transporting ATPase subunit alpha
LLLSQVFQIPFNSRNKWMMSVNLSPANREYVAYLKGAPEIIVGRCTTYLGKDGSVLPIDEAFRGRFQDMYQEVARKGERVLALSMRRLDAGEWPVGISARTMFKDREEQLPRDGLTFVGMMSLVDPPKQGVAEAVLKCKAAGIRVMMITGDHPLTAEAIARQVSHDSRSACWMMMKQMR